MDYCVIVRELQNLIDVVIIVVNVVVFVVVVFVIGVPLIFCNSNCFRLLSRYVHNQRCTELSLEVNGGVERALDLVLLSCFLFFVLLLCVCSCSITGICAFEPAG
jgi:hypothetical protein